MGIAGKHVLKTFGPYQDIKVRYVPANKIKSGVLVLREPRSDHVIWGFKLRVQLTSIVIPHTPQVFRHRVSRRDARHRDVEGG